MPACNSHLNFFELLNLIRCGSNTAYELGLTYYMRLLHQKHLSCLRRSDLFYTDFCTYHEALRWSTVKNLFSYILMLDVSKYTLWDNLKHRFANYVRI